MSAPNSSSSPLEPDVPSDVGAGTPAGRLSAFFAHLNESLPEQSSAVARRMNQEDRLAQVRLGIAAGLFVALRAKHPPTASHSLRVAIGTSYWVLGHPERLGELDPAVLEVSALLHDIGKIGVPDRILTKPSGLSSEEKKTMDQHRRIGVQILLSCCASQAVLDTVAHVPAWFDGTRGSFPVHGTDLPVGSRIIAIVDAYDAMTTDHVYRKALSRDQAIAELFRFAGRQFDPELVEEFAALTEGPTGSLHQAVTRRWLHQLQPALTDDLWLPEVGVVPGESGSPETHFFRSMLDHVRDAVIYVDREGLIRLWNRAAERLTGISGRAMVARQWSPNVLKWRGADGGKVADDACPVQEALARGTQIYRPLLVEDREGQWRSVDVHAIPVAHDDGTIHGISLLLHDTSQRVTLERRLAALQHRATRDPLTQVANRAEFDRLHRLFIDDHTKRGIPCSLAICDLDFFKSINDTYGHQAGDEAIVAFASLLTRHCREGDLVARYGGEEFVLLWVDCDIATAAQRAERIRQQWEQVQLPSLEGKTLTASFGVTELQPGDTAETMLRRADRALLQAKDNGRNMVVQIGGTSDIVAPSRTDWRRWFRWLWRDPTDGVLLQRTVATAVPLRVAAEKLRGFIADHRAEILHFSDDRVALLVPPTSLPMLRRKTDRPVAFVVELAFSERDRAESGFGKETLVSVTIRPRRTRDRRRRDGRERAHQLLASLKSYLMATDYLSEL